MKLLVISEYAPRGSGYTTILRSMLAEWERREHQVVVLAFEYSGAEHPFKAAIVPSDPLKIQSQFAYARAGFRPDAVVVILDLSLHYSLRATQTAGIPYIGVFVVESDPLIHPSEWTNNIDTMSAAFCITQFGTKLLTDAGLRARHLPIGVDTEFWRPPAAEERRTARERWNLGERFVVLTVADNQERKNLAAHFSAVALLAGREFEWPPFMQHGRRQKLGRHAVPDAYWILNTKRRPRQVGYTNFELSQRFDIQQNALILEHNANEGLEDEGLRELYWCADAFLLLSKAEGYGLPVLEAMACFTGDTRVSAAEITATMQRHYTGELLSVRTARVTLRVTPEHPFWTNRGWVPAKELSVSDKLWYYSCCNAEQRMEKINTGPIEAVVCRLSEDALARSRPTLRNDTGTSRMAFTFGGQAEESLGCNFSREDPNSSRYRVGLYCGIDRWGRYDYDSTNGPEVETSDSDCKQLHSFDAVVEPNDWNARSAMVRKIESEGSIYIRDFGLNLPAPVQRSSPISGNKTSTYGIGDRVDGMPTATITPAEFHSPPEHDRSHDPLSEPEAILEINSVFVTNLPVFNFSTASETYLAEGYLVHNCGVPVVGTDCTGIRESLHPDRGYLVDPEYVHIDPYHNQYRRWADPVEAARHLSEIARKRPEVMIERAIYHARDFTWAKAGDVFEEALMEAVNGRKGESETREDSVSEPALLG